MGGKNSKSKQSRVSVDGDSSGSGAVKLLSLSQVEVCLSAFESPVKVGLTTCYSVKQESKDDFIAAVKELDTPKFLELFAGAASVDIFADATTDGVFWSLITDDKPEDLLKYLADEKVVTFNEGTAGMLQEPTGYFLYRAI